MDGARIDVERKRELLFQTTLAYNARLSKKLAICVCVCVSQWTLQQLGRISRLRENVVKVYALLALLALGVKTKIWSFALMW